MRCPYCGDVVHDPGADRFCPSCGKEIPHRTKDERAIIRDGGISVGLLVLSIVLIILGASFLLPDIIIRWIDPEMELMYFPYSLVVLLIGFALLFVRIPFSRRSRSYAAVLMEETQAKWKCSYCGAENVPGSLDCRSCGAPLK